MRYILFFVSISLFSSLLASEPPQVIITSPLNGTIVEGEQVSVSYVVSASAPQSVIIRVDGRNVQLLTDVRLGENTAVVDIPDKDCEISVVARNSFGEGAATVKLVRSGVVFKPSLYILAIGISNYNNPSLRLQFPAKDAADFAMAMTR